MCGIAGIINYQENDAEKMKNALLHRGPDEQSIYYYQNLTLVHTRLAIQDINHGKQPMHYQDYAIIFNGEIYNHLELRQSLPEFQFLTQSDTETLLYLYIKYQQRMFAMLDGMFAFAILNKKDNQIIMARDRCGKKPLYYYQDASLFIFASELNAIKTVKKLAINEDAINVFLRNGFFYNTMTPYINVTELAPGTCMSVDLASYKIKTESYFDILQYYNEPKREISYDDATKEVESCLIKSVKNRLLSSELEVGAFLSGGIDSNLIVAVASQIQPNIKTFTVRTEGATNESAYAKLTANRYGTTHIEVDINVTQNLVEDIEKILLNYGEPFADSSAIPSYYVAKAAKQHVKVILNGDGADELFGGYRRYVPFSNNWLAPARYFSWLKNIIPSNKKRSGADFISRLLNMSHKTGLNLYLAATTDIFEDTYTLAENPWSSAQNQTILKIMKSPNLTKLSKIMYLDFIHILANALLVKMDIATMANSLEGRSPFLSKYFLEFAPTLPDNFKINKFTTKSVLRNLAKKYLDDTLIHLPKKGFEIPLPYIVDVVLHEKIRSYLHSDCFVRKFVDLSFIQNLLNKQVNTTDAKRINMIWVLFCVEVWYQHNA